MSPRKSIHRLAERLRDRYVRPQFGVSAELLAAAGPFAAPRAPATRDRAALLRTHVDRAAKVLEFGPLAAPIVPKRDGWNAFSVDKEDRAALVARYEAFPFVDTRLIEEVDFVWAGGGSILDVVPAAHHGTFDVVVMSHVLEHIPDPLRFLADIARLLKPDGHVSLAFPDKRDCFDALRPLTTASAWLEARLRGDTAYTRQTLFEHSAFALARRAQVTWIEKRLRIEDISLMQLIEDVHATYYGPTPPSGHIDCHAWVCTPASFALILHECHALGASPLALDDITDSHLGEFIAHLTLAPRRPLNHHQRVKLIVQGAGEQADGYARFKPTRADPIRALVQRFIKRRSQP